MFIYLFTDLFNKYLLSACDMPGAMLAFGDTVMGKNRASPDLGDA